jgi:arylsulfatase
MPDQLRPDFLGCYGAGFVATPHIDGLAARGVRFNRAYSEHPVCVPARAALLTGRHAVRTGVLDNGLFVRPDYAACGLATWPELLARGGYHTAGIGKMHFYPWDAALGFQYRRIAEDKRWLHIRDDYYHYLRAHGQRKYHGNEHAGYHEQKGAIVNRLPWELQPDHFVGLEADRFIRAYGREQPFALMIGFPGPHCPYDPAADWLARIDPAAMPAPIPDAGHTPGLRARNIAGNRRPWNGVDYTEFTDAQKRRLRAHYAALVEQIDHEVGAVVAALRDADLLENTVIIVASDHGDYLGDHGLIGKGHFYESSFHVPLIVAGPGVERGAARDDLVALTDVTATLLRLGGVEAPTYLDSRPLPGVGIAGATGRDHLIGALGDAWMIQAGPWRLARYGGGEAVLFDLAADPTEQHNLIDDPGHRRIARDLDGRLTDWMMAAMVDAHAAQRVYTADLSQDVAFGREGWQRRYPLPLAP